MLTYVRPTLSYILKPSSSILHSRISVEMGNCLNLSSSPIHVSSKTAKALPIDTPFNLPSPIPTWPQGDGFGTGTVDLGGLIVCQISSFTKVWATHEGGPDNVGASFFEPFPIPEGFSMLGCYSQSNSKPLFGHVLVGKDIVRNSSPKALKKPIDYTLAWTGEGSKIKQDGIGYIWLPTPPDGYKAVGHVITTSPEKPSLDRIRCVRSDLTEESKAGTWIWGAEKVSNANEFNLYTSLPSNIGPHSLGVSIGTFVIQNASMSMFCLKNNNAKSYHYMPNMAQVEALIQNYSPYIYFHPDEKYLPSSVTWFFTNGGLLYTRGDESNPVKIDPTGSNLPQGGSNDGAYWLDLPADGAAKERVKRGDIQSSQAYFHVKPMLGATFTDLQIWVYYPFNGPSRAKVEFITVSLGEVGEHVGDWEHVTLRVSNFNGELHGVYLSQHSGGVWVSPTDMEFENGNKPVAYASLNGHALYSKPGLVLQGSGKIGIRNDAAKGKVVMDTGVRALVVSGAEVVEPPWLNYCRKWGPKITYDLAKELNDVKRLLPGFLRSRFEKVVKSLPSEVFGEDGPTGPKVKGNWDGDEV